MNRESITPCKRMPPMPSNRWLVVAAGLERCPVCKGAVEERHEYGTCSGPCAKRMEDAAAFMRDARQFQRARGR